MTGAILVVGSSINKNHLTFFEHYNRLKKESMAEPIVVVMDKKTKDIVSSITPDEANVFYLGGDDVGLTKRGNGLNLKRSTMPRIQALRKKIIERTPSKKK